MATVPSETGRHDPLDTDGGGKNDPEATIDVGGVAETGTPQQLSAVERLKAARALAGSPESPPLPEAAQKEVDQLIAALGIPRKEEGETRSRVEKADAETLVKILRIILCHNGSIQRDLTTKTDVTGTMVWGAAERHTIPYLTEREQAAKETLAAEVGQLIASGQKVRLHDIRMKNRITAYRRLLRMSRDIKVLSKLPQQLHVSPHTINKWEKNVAGTPLEELAPDLFKAPEAPAHVEAAGAERSLASTEAAVVEVHGQGKGLTPLQRDQVTAIQELYRTATDTLAKLPPNDLGRGLVALNMRQCLEMMGQVLGIPERNQVPGQLVAAPNERPPQQPDTVLTIESPGARLQISSSMRGAVILLGDQNAQQHTE